MKICLTSTSDNLEAQIDPRFGRCAYLLIVDPETMEFEVVSNMAAASGGGAGIQAAQTIANSDVKVLITGNVGPKAFKALSAASIEIMMVNSGSVREVVEKFKKGELQRVGSPTVGEHFGSNMQRRGVWSL